MNLFCKVYGRVTYKSHDLHHRVSIIRHRILLHILLGPAHSEPQDNEEILIVVDSDQVVVVTACL